MPVANRGPSGRDSGGRQSGFHDLPWSGRQGARLLVCLLRGFGAVIRLEAELAPGVGEFLRVRQTRVRHHRA